jgi:hypothetical protein
VFVFNPFTEAPHRRSKSFNPASTRRVARDLENLPQFLCRQDD